LREIHISPEEIHIFLVHLSESNFRPSQPGGKLVASLKESGDGARPSPRRERAWPIARFVLLTASPRYVRPLFPSLCGALPFAVASPQFVRRRRHRPLCANSFGNGFAHLYTHRDGFASSVTFAHSDGLAYAHFGGASDEDAAAIAIGRAPNRKELLANWRHFNGWNGAKCGWVRVRADG